MSESGSRSRIRQVIGWDIHGLDRGNRTLLGRGDTLLPRSEVREIHGHINDVDSHATHVCRERRLVTDGRGNTTEKSGHLGAGLGEAENVVDE
jgi:hypothetical protein